jgi:hypothetical protein
MVVFKSDLTNKNVHTDQLREFDVPDETEKLDQNQINAMNQRMVNRGLHPLDEATIQYMARNQAQKNVLEQDNIINKQNSFNDLSQIERAAREARQVRNTGKNRLSESAKRRIEVLCEMSRVTRSVNIDGNIFVLRNLKSKEQREAFVKIAEFDGTVQFAFEMRRQILARSLFKIAETDIELFLGDDSLDAKLEFLDELDESVISKLYDEYLELSKESSAKYIVNSDKVAQEVAEDLKK